MSDRPRKRSRAPKRGARRSRPRTPALGALRTPERAEVLDCILAMDPDLRREAEEFARAIVDRGSETGGLAEEVLSELEALGLDVLNERSGTGPDGHYTDPTDGAHEALTEAFAPYLEQLARLRKLRKTRAATEFTKGLLDGLYLARDSEATCLEWAPDFASDAAEDLVEGWAKAEGASPRCLAEIRTFVASRLPEWQKYLESSLARARGKA